MGTRIPVYAVLELVREGIPFEQIVRDYYLDLTANDVKACVEAAHPQAEWVSDACQNEAGV